MKDVEWVGPSLDDLKAFPNDVQSDVGFALYQAQCGKRHPDAKPLKGFGGATTLEIVTNYDGDTYRTVYTVRLETAVYVLHAFQKTSTRGVTTPRRDMEPYPSTVGGGGGDGCRARGATAIKRGDSHGAQRLRRPGVRELGGDADQG